LSAAVKRVVDIIPDYYKLRVLAYIHVAIVVVPSEGKPYFQAALTFKTKLPMSELSKQKPDLNIQADKHSIERSLVAFNN